MALRVVRHPKAATEFFQLPPHVRAVYERAIRRMTVEPLTSCPGNEVSQLSPVSGIVSPVGSMKVGGFRVFFIVDGGTAKIGGSGARPGFYQKLSRAQELLRDRPSPRM